MLASITVGDNVTTIGGICGKIVSVNDDILTLEVGSDKVKLVLSDGQFVTLIDLIPTKQKLRFQRNQLFFIPGRCISLFPTQFLLGES